MKELIKVHQLWSDWPTWTTWPQPTPRDHYSKREKRARQMHLDIATFGLKLHLEAVVWNGVEIAHIRTEWNDAFTLNWMGICFLAYNKLMIENIQRCQCMIDFEDPIEATQPIDHRHHCDKKARCNLTVLPPWPLMCYIEQHGYISEFITLSQMTLFVERLLLINWTHIISHETLGDIDYWLYV